MPLFISIHAACLVLILISILDTQHVVHTLSITLSLTAAANWRTGPRASLLVMVLTAPTLWCPTAGG